MIVVGNWKMNLHPMEAAQRATELAELCEGISDIEIGIAPTFVSLHAVTSVLKSSRIGVAGQDVFWRDYGAYTGYISAPMLTEIGCEYAIVGHSERRGRFGKLEVAPEQLPFFSETDSSVNSKVSACLDHGLVPIVCVGETLAEREEGRTDAVIAQQIEGAIADVGEEELEGCVFAYEPVWAIGTGQVCDSKEANRVCGFIHSMLPPGSRVQYGGSVNPGNALELFSQPHIDGGLVGGASLKPEEFIHVIRAALEVSC